MTAVPPEPVVGVDVGGTKIAAGVVAADGTVRSRDRVSTPTTDASDVRSRVADLVRGLGGSSGAGAVGVAVPGLVGDDGSVRAPPNLPFDTDPVGPLLRDVLDAYVAVLNDADAAAWGEFHVGAGRGAAVSVTLTVGTGIGSGLVTGGTLHRGVDGFGAEFGHMLVAEGGLRCPCGNLGCLEAYASGRALARTARRNTASTDVAARFPNGEAVLAAARENDPAAESAFVECGEWLGVGVASVVNAVAPEVVVVGGGVTDGAGELLLQPARRAYEERLFGRGARSAPPLVAGQLAGDGGVVGAGMFARAAAGG